MTYTGVICLIIYSLMLALIVHSSIKKHTYSMHIQACIRAHPLTFSVLVTRSGWVSPVSRLSTDRLESISSSAWDDKHKQP